MAGRDLFATDQPDRKLSDLIVDQSVPGTPPRDLFANDADVQRQNRLRAIAKAALPPAGNPSDEVFKDAFTLGLQGPTSGLANAVGGGIKGLFGAGDDSTFGERYRAGEQAYDERLQDMRNQAPDATAAGLMGGLLTGGGATRAAQSIPRIAAESAGLAGVDATARARGDLTDRLEQGATGAAVGGVTGAALGTVMQNVLPGFIARRAAARQAARGPDPDALRAEARTLYRQLDNTGITYDPQTYAALPRDTRTELLANGYSPTLPEHGSIGPLMNDMNNIVTMANANGGAVPFSELQNLRSQATDVAASPNPGARRLAGIVRDSIDNFVQNAQPSQGFMSGPQAADMWAQARDGWRRASKTDDLLWNVTKAERRAASTASGGNEQNALRQNVRGMLDRAERPRGYNPYSPEETQAMEGVINGTPTQNALRTFGNAFGASGWGGVTSTSAGAGISHMLGMSPELSTAVGAGLYGAGRFARTRSTRMAQDQVDNLIRLMATGSAAPVAAAGPPQAISMADALAQRLAARTAPAVTREAFSGGGW